MFEDKFEAGTARAIDAVKRGFVKLTRSDNGAVSARKPGYTRVYRFPGGLFSWKGANFPLEEVKYA